MLSFDIFAIGMPGPTELIIILVIALLIFGRRLPEVARNMGRGIVEFKKGVKGIEDDVDDSSSHAAPKRDVFRGDGHSDESPSEPPGPSGGMKH